MLTSRSALEGERKQVTVLERMIEAVHRYEGIVNQVLGDGIMALFGAPIAHEDHAVRACYAALRMQETVSSAGLFAAAWLSVLSVKTGLLSKGEILSLILRGITRRFFCTEDQGAAAF